MSPNTHITSLILLLSTLSFLSPILAHPLSPPQQQELDSGFLEPPTQGDYIVSLSTGKCLTPSSDPPTKGNSVISVKCEGAKTWHVPYSSGYLGLQAVGLAVQPDNLGKNDVKLALAVPEQGNKDQIWLWGSGNRISTANGTKCLAMGEGGPQMEGCDPLSTSQIWAVRNTTQPVALDALSKMTEVDSHALIHPRGRNDICLAVVSPEEAHAGHGVAFTYCSGKGDRPSIRPLSTSYSLMQWSLPSSPSSAGQVKLASSSLCLATGARVINATLESTTDTVFGDGMAVSIENCEEGRQGQRWFWNGVRLRSARGDANQCLSILSESGPVEMANFINLRAVYTWKCPQDEDNENVAFST